MKNFLLIPLLLISVSLFGQWTDSFDQSALSPEWIGDRQDFVITPDKKLQLRGISAGKSHIFRSYVLKDTLFWSFDFRLDFDPSASNALKFFLLTDRTDSIDLSPTYSFEIGETGNNDRWKIFANTIQQSVLMASGEMGRLANEPAMAQIKITRYPDSTWIVESDYSSQLSYTTESIFKDTFYLKPDSTYFGIECEYTSTRIDKFFFDNIAVGKKAQDVSPPIIEKIDSIAGKTIKIIFNENVDELSAVDINHYTILSYGKPILVEPFFNSPTVFLLHFDFSFKAGTAYILEYMNMKDKSGNITPRSEIRFTSTQIRSPDFQEILINEMMVDPNPPVGMPDREYVELRNVSNEIVNLNQCMFKDLSGETILPNYLLGPDEYLILCAIKDTGLFNPFGKTLGLDPFPSLNNTDETLTLFNPDRELIYTVSYSDSWYQSTIKKEGGYSLELINKGDLCSGSSNWKGSDHPAGGTPGKINSVDRFNPDTAGPVLLELIPISEWEIQLTFDKDIDEGIIFRVAQFSLSPSRSIATVDRLRTMSNALILLLEHPLLAGVEYTLRIEEIMDCSKNKTDHIEITFVLPANPAKGDILINEILFDPVSFGVDFIEIINVSNKVLSTANLFFKNKQEEDRWFPIQSGKVLFPNSYLAFTPDPEITFHQYPEGDSSRIIKSTIPICSDDEGVVLLSYYTQPIFIVLDSLPYNRDWHNRLLPDKEGVSLERIRLKGQTEDKQNWQSAAAYSNYGTPGAKNSQLIDTSLHTTKNKPYIFSTHHISPDFNGVHDELVIHFNLEESGYKILAEAFDLSGFKIKTISTQILGTQDILRWDGTNEEGNKVLPGNYIIHLRLIHTKGITKNYKELVSVIK
jgi:hypothetical protein